MSLRRLYLTGKLESFTIWMEKLRKLVKIFLKASSLPNDPLVTLEQLPDLVHIELHQVFNGKEMHLSKVKFKKLKNLGLHELESLERVIVDKTAMPNLERFTLHDCGSLKSLPAGIEHLTTLKVLDCVYMPEELITSIQALPSQIQHIPEVNFIRIVDGVLDNSRLTHAEDGINESTDVSRTNTMQRLNAFIDN
uniref:Uncharacterized protein n=1 Tax=Kalanchoe fedtschenkoi TaxID=63787 RepID=A0A7N0U549_KALFE